MLRKIRILILLLILATVGLTAWRANARLSAWEDSVQVAVYPIAADDSPATARFVASLDAESFADLRPWMQAQSERYGRAVLQPVVLAHELLHTFGATDKYDPATLLPAYPEGYAEPELDPRLPQRRAEIMAGRIPVDAGHADIPASLADTVVGPATAREIGLLKPTSRN